MGCCSVPDCGLNHRNNLDNALFTGSRFSNCKLTDTKMSHNYKGVPMNEIKGSENPHGSPEFPMIPVDRPDHAVLFLPGERGQPPRPRPGPDMWNDQFVKLPCSNKSEYSDNGVKILRWNVIKDRLSKRMNNVQDLIDTILSYNQKYEKIWSFRTLKEIFNEDYSVLTEDEIQTFFSKILPAIARLALKLPELVRSPIPLLKQKKNFSISLSQEQISTLLANAFFCTFPQRNSHTRNSQYSSYPFINFSSLFAAKGDDVVEKLKCIINYFNRVCSQPPVGVVTFTRRSVPKNQCPRWDSEIPLSTVKLHVDPEGVIEQAEGLIQLDFANKFLGGGVLNHGSVQEEIRFVISPELMVSMLFTEVLLPEEAIIIIGAEQYSKYIGYSRSFQFMGDNYDSAPLDGSNRRKVAVLAIDALPFKNKKQEYKNESIVRELNKAWVGFSIYCDPLSNDIEYPGVATGNWGCGAFGGSPQLKALIQLMACAEARRPLAYFTFGDRNFTKDFYEMYQKLVRHSVTVGDLFYYITKFAKEDSQLRDLFSFLHRILDKEGRRQRFKRKTESPPNTVERKKSNCQPQTPQCSNNSPDFFSQDDEENLQKINSTSSRQNHQSGTNNSLTDSDVEMAILNVDQDDRDKCETMAIDNTEASEVSRCNHNNQEITPHMSKTRLFEEMDKLYGQSKPNTSISHRSFLNDSPKVTSNDKATPGTPKGKSKNNKITAYFSPKPKTSK